jgi:acyl phosphate:glycerol-3-phosphate acyltransferase
VIYPLAFLVLTYAVAAIPFAVVITTLWGGEVDVRAEGSGNPGATNVARLYGWGMGGVVMALDIFKGLAPVVAARLLWPAWDPWWGALVALVAFSAHVFPVYLEFRGGKGVATASGGLVALAPLPTLGAAAVWAALLAITGRSSVAALGASVVALGLAVWLAPQVVALAVVLAVAIGVTHTANLRRLFRGEEKAVVPTARWTHRPAEGAIDALEQGPAGLGGVAPDPWPRAPAEREA